ncbi:efflux RND transporter periplasmic adaptor subunit [Magnetococcales bacterium HHB-1]
MKKYALLLIITLLALPQTTLSASNPYTIRALLEPIKEAVISSEMDGRIIHMPFKAGDTFKKGERLVAFDCALQKAQRQVAHTDLKSARNKLTNLKQLGQLESAGVLDILLAKNDVEHARAVIHVNTIAIKRCTIHTPFAGRVVATHANVYEYVKTGTPLIEILNHKKWQITLVAPSTWLPHLKKGAPFAIVFDETKTRLSAKIKQIGAKIDPVSQTIKVYGTFKKIPENLTAGMSGAADFSSLFPTSITP